MKTLRLLENIATFILVLIFVYSIVGLASVGRFTNTHAIQKQSLCVDCHADALIELNNGRHINDMKPNQSTVIESFFLIRGQPDLQGLCLSCHNVRQDLFAFKNFNITTKKLNGTQKGAAYIEDIVLWETNNSNLTRMNDAVLIMYENSVETIILNENMTDNFNGYSGKSCSTAGGLCHIYQRITDIGIRKGDFYAHELPNTNRVCRTCHLY